MFITISYDIADNRRRQRLAKLLLNYGHRVQKSVFEVQVDDRQYLKLKKSIGEIIDWEDDSVRYYFLCSRCLGNIEISGWGVVREDEEVIVV
jgi:CRISPR-associated protein Cas2